MTRGWKLAHVRADPGEENLGRSLAHARNLLGRSTMSRKGRERGLDPRVDGRNRSSQLLNCL